MVSLTFPVNLEDKTSRCERWQARCTNGRDRFASKSFSLSLET